MRVFWQDLRYTLRQLRLAPAFTLTAILTLALGLGANAAIFSLFDQALLRALPVRDPAQLVVLQGTGKAWEGHSSNHGGGQEAYFSYPMYRDLRDKNQAFTGTIATAPANVILARPGLATHEQGEIVSGNYFTTLGVAPALGRVLSQADDTAANPIAVLSYAFWHDQLAENPAILGQTLSINAHLFQVVGIAASGFRSAVWGQSPAVFVPMSMLDQVVPGKGGRLEDHQDRWLNILGRLKPGTTTQAAQAALAPLWHALRADELKALGTRTPEFTREFLTNSRLLAEPGARGFSYDRESYEQPLEAVLAMALLVLAMAAVNVASLLLVRSAARAREFSLRLALGASTGRLAAQLLLEGLLLGTAGAAAALLLAPAITRFLVRFLQGDEAFSDFTPAFDGRLIAYTCAAALLVSLLFSLAPILQLRRLRLANMTYALRETTGTATGGTLRFRRAVVFLQIALSVLLLTGASLFVRTVQKLRAVDPGFATARLLTFAVAPKLGGYAPEAIPALYDRILATLQGIPGVAEAAATDDPELADSGQTANLTIAGFTPSPDVRTEVEKASITPGFFTTMRIPLLAGRFFTAQDAHNQPLVAIVNQTFASRFCNTSPNQCLGKRIALGEGNNVHPDTEIVGVVRDSKHINLRDPIDPTLFRPIRQTELAGPMYFYLRTLAHSAPAVRSSFSTSAKSDPGSAAALASIRRAMQQLAPGLPLVALRTMSSQLDDSLASERTLALLATAFGALAAALAGVGIYGVLAYSTAQRTRELGIRLALGSPRSAIGCLVLGDVLRLTALALAAALPLAYGGSRLLRAQFFGISPADPLSFLAATLLIAAVALAAGGIPALRATRIDPSTALRTE